MPIEQRLGVPAQRDSAHPANQNAMRMPLDGIVKFAIKHCQGIFQRQCSRGKFLPFRVLIALYPFASAASRKAVSHVPLIMGKDIDAETAVSLQDRPG